MTFFYLSVIISNEVLIMNEIYVAHEIIFNKNFNRHDFYHGNLSGCQFNNQYLVSKEVVLLTVNDKKELCFSFGNPKILHSAHTASFVKSNNLYVDFCKRWHQEKKLIFFE